MRQVFTLLSQGSDYLKSIDEYLVFLQSPDLHDDPAKAERTLAKFRALLPLIVPEAIEKMRTDGFYNGFTIQTDIYGEFIRFSPEMYCDQMLEYWKQQKENLKN